MKSPVSRDFKSQIITFFVVGLISFIPTSLFMGILTVTNILIFGFPNLLSWGSNDSSDSLYLIGILIIFYSLFSTFIWNKYSNKKNQSRISIILIFFLYLAFGPVTILANNYINSYVYKHRQISERNLKCSSNVPIPDTTINSFTYRADCKNGLLTGEVVSKQGGTGTAIVKTYKNSVLVSEAYLNEIGATTLFVEYNPRSQYGRNVYFQLAEMDLKYSVLGNPNSYCNGDTPKYLSENQKYSCNKGKMNGKWSKSFGGGLEVSAMYVDGQLNGIFEYNYRGDISYVEFKNDLPHGQVYKKRANGQIEYSGNYNNGLQEGEFYFSKSSLRFLFSRGRLVKYW